ncbi:hypothetical protein [Dyella nitratireducens]|uniref:Poly-beta-1,6-N-acetyl-D-glucosamine biosynthesis protein PgaD n=1 Tax=Dyella nitratireducens TaxID=1849580 RepID=A0ABQ1FTF4_9GAMM|nr:hypothetical protein [Dyella nitratireducens]GGA28786.1 hypothetical protein GCM10010981_17010 [Dyella nitratireducens]GLQ43234.1 hypothetical protein GCM10007902_30840 [Dyella nitratireducens]
MGSKSSGGNRKTTIDRRVTWAQAFRDIFVAALNKGQLLPVTMSFGLLIWLWRMDASALPGVWYDFRALLLRHEIVGYVLWIVTLLGWIAHARFVKGTTDAESGRIGKEKTSLQEKLAARSFSSSRNLGD